MTKTIRLSCRDDTFASLSLSVACRAISDLGFDGVDISVSDRYQQIDASSVLDHPLEEGANVSSQVREAGLEVADVFIVTGFGPNTIGVNHEDPDLRSASRAQFEGYLRFASALGSPGISLLPGSADQGPYEIAVQELRWRQVQAADAGLRLSIEPYQTSVVKSPDEVLGLIDDVPGLRLTVDHSHFVAAGYADEEADLLLPHAGHVQARQARSGLIQTSLDKGEIDFGRIVSRLREQDYGGWIGTEYLWAPWINEEIDTLGQTRTLGLHIRSLLNDSRANGGTE